MKSSQDEKFYANLPVLDSFFEVANPNNYHPLPDNWLVGVTDIESSTKAVENNQYKRVNILGASPIIGLLNESTKENLPYSFGGDGCAICFPPDLRDQAAAVFAACQKIGKAEYDLNLRAAIIPLKHIREHGYDVRVSRFRISEVYRQAVFTGGGLSFAEDMLKSQEGSSFHIEPKMENEEIQADFTGLECRWQEVSSPNKLVISLLVQANPQSQSPEEIYNHVLLKMREIFGFDDQTNPILSSELNMNFSVPELMGETQFRTFGQSWWKRLKYLAKVELQTILGKALMLFNYHSSATDWSLYKPDLALNSDHRKFDDMLRLVISGTPEQQKKLSQYLHQQYEQTKLAYGIHTSEAALITCMVFSYHRNHIHFVDGNEGGYVNAAKKLKVRLKDIEKKNESNGATH